MVSTLNHIINRMKNLPTTIAIAIILSVFVGGCQTMAQRQASSMREDAQTTGQKIKACIGNIENNPNYKPISKHMPLDATKDPSLTQLADNEIPSEQEAQLIIAIHNEFAPCRERAIEDYSKIAPGIIPILVQAYHASDLISAELIQRKISWGEANKMRTALRNDYMAKMQVAVAQMDRDLNSSHQAELAQRQAAFDSLANWSYQQQLLMQNQQKINAISRPVTTNCIKVGSQLHCTSN